MLRRKLASLLCALIPGAPVFLFATQALALPWSYVSSTHKFHSHQLLVLVCAFGVRWDHSTKEGDAVMFHCQDDSLNSHFLHQGNCPLASPAYCPLFRLLCPPQFSESPSFPLFFCFKISTIPEIMREPLTPPKLPLWKKGCL